MSKTMAEKVWNDHVVRPGGDGEPDLLYIDLHLIHEVTSPQAFDGLRATDRPVRRPDLTLATEDHNVPTEQIDRPIADPISRAQVEALRANCAEFGVPLFPLGNAEQGIVHVVGPQLGLTQPGMTVVCGDSHTSTHGAFGALAFGIGTSEVEHVLATQTLPLKPFRTMAVTVNGELPDGVTAKDIILAVIAQIGTGGGQGYVIEYRGSAIESLSMEARMTICNMSIEAGARAGMIAPDQTTFDYLKGRERAPQGGDWDAAVEYWAQLRSDPDAVFDKEVVIDAASLSPFVTWGTNPGQGLPLSASVPAPEDFDDEVARDAARRALEYMGLTPGTPLREVQVDTVFVGSCTNGRIEDLRAVAELLQGRRVADGVRMLVVPGSVRVKEQAEREGLGEVFTAAGAEWREAGCSMCLAMNPDKLSRGERAASTSNRNFEGRQGPGGRTHLVSPQVAAAIAVTGRLSAPSDLNPSPECGAEGSIVMEKFTVHEGTAAPLRHSNVDTDQIIPAEYLKRITRSGFEDGLFAAWRGDPDFVLNRPEHEDVTVLIAGPDFGTGSSREHAVWALQDYGFRVVISSRFADIFRSNAGKNGLLPALVDDSTLERLWEFVEAEPGSPVVVDLEAQEVRVGDLVASFDVDPAVKWRLLNGLDDIAITMSHADDIDAYEATRPSFKPVTAG